MLNVAHHATHLLMQVAVASGKVSFATLQSPSEHAELSRGRAVGLPIDQWWLSANVPAEMFRLAENGALRHLGEFVVGDAGTVYAVLAQQVGPWQHRFVLQVFGKQMREYLSAAYETGFVLSLGHQGQDECLVVPDCTYLHSLRCEDLGVAQEDGHRRRHQGQKESVLNPADLERQHPEGESWPNADGVRSHDG